MVGLKSFAREFNADASLSWPILVFERLGYLGPEDTPVLEDKSWFGSRVYSVTRLQEEVDCGKANLREVHVIVPIGDSSGRFLSVDDLTELHYQGILDWAVKNGLIELTNTAFGTEMKKRFSSRSTRDGILYVGVGLAQGFYFGNIWVSTSS